MIFFKFEENHVKSKKVMKMEAYTELAKHPVFSIDDVKKHTTNGKTAYSQLDRLMKKDLVRKI